jgi:hypothetical protein
MPGEEKAQKQDGVVVALCSSIGGKCPMDKTTEFPVQQ